MAYPAFRNAQTQYSTATTSLVITKPTGLAVGDYMLAIIRLLDGSNLTITPPAGWTSIFNNGSTTTAFNFFEKTAEAADVSASNFTFTTSSSADHFIGAIAAFSGVSSRQDYDFIQTTSNATSGTVSATPLINDSLVISTLVAYDNALSATLTYSAQSITPSVTMTERVDTGFRTAGSDGISIFIASGENSGIAPVTAFSFTTSEATVANNNHGGVIILTGSQNATGDVSHLAVTPSISGATATVSIGADVSHLAVTPAVEGLDTTSSSARTQWQTESKPTTNWVDE